MVDPILERALGDAGVPAFIDSARESAIVREVASKVTQDAGQPTPERLPRIAYVYETKCIEAYKKGIRTTAHVDFVEARNCASKAFDCWRALVTLPSDDEAAPGGGVSRKGCELAGVDSLGLGTNDLLLGLHLAVAGVISEQTAETRIELQRFELNPPDRAASWRDRVLVQCLRAFVLLVRKSRGWADIDEALLAIQELRGAQHEFEAGYLDGIRAPESQKSAALELVGLYHLAQQVTLTGEYLRDGGAAIARISLELERHLDRAIQAFAGAGKHTLLHVVSLIWLGSRELAQNSIWTHMAGLGEAARDLGATLAARAQERPVLELWPSQRDALRANLLDPYRRAVIVEMPTSGGKTLLAKFSIVQSKALNPGGTTAYVVPTRALVNQVSSDLRSDFRGLRVPLRVEQAVPAFELDPTEERLLRTIPDVLVTTPEKLDLLIRRNHPATQHISLVIADEAHNLREQGRGARLELLLGTIKRERADVRFLLLSPFLPNDEELVRWLGEERALPPIRIHWRPSKRVVGSIYAVGRGRKRSLILETLPAAGNVDTRAGVRIPIGPGVPGTAVSELSREATKGLLDRGSVLILCRGQKTAATRAAELAEELPEVRESDFSAAVGRFIEAEVGRDSKLRQCLKHGVAYHHAGLSHDARWLIEALVKRNEVKVVCGTTTLAQGVNFPICSVLLETLKKGDADLTYQDFWNIAGRAGRTLVDSVGVVGFPSPRNKDLEELTDFLRGEALEISSQLAELIDRADQIGDRFNLYAVRNWPALSTLLQFLAHAMHVSGRDNVADEVEDILRASLVYHQARRTGDQAAQRLLRLCRNYLQQLAGKRGLVALADRTGFATPSVSQLMFAARQDRELSEVGRWAPDRLFGEDVTPLRKRVELISNLPEIQLGQGDRGPFNPELVARILKDWVRGDPLGAMAERYYVGEEEDEEGRTAEFSRYLFSDLLGKASWGIGALEAVSLAGTAEDQWANAGYVPSMIFYGVARKEAVWLRMAGVPRIVANQLAGVWQQGGQGDPESYDAIRNWVGQLNDPDWSRAIPRGSALSPQDMRILCRELAS